MLDFEAKTAKLLHAWIDCYMLHPYSGANWSCIQTPLIFCSAGCILQLVTPQYIQRYGIGRSGYKRDYAAIAAKVLACGICFLATPVVCVDKEFECYTTFYYCTLPGASFTLYSSLVGVALKWSTFWLGESIVILRLRTKMRKLHYILL